MLQAWAICGLSAFTFVACLWDRDTLAEEAKGRPETVRVIVGWFDRFPDRYYEMRLERVSRQLEGGQLNAEQYWELIDDAAVACDRLGRYDEAIAWMRKKEAVLEGPSTEHRYRYLANLGTFYAHKWISLPAETRNTDLSLLKKAAGLIDQAIEENPDAHFGREIYQLMAIRWLAAKPTDSNQVSDIWIERRFSANADEDVEGITGLIQLGAAWNSIDVFHTLTAALESSREGVLAELSYHRELELYNAGRRSINPNPKVTNAVVPTHSRTLEEFRHKGVERYYTIAREAADARNKAWLDYQEDRYAKGMHPDTHPHFWNDWEEPEMPKIPGPSLSERLGGNGTVIYVTLLIGALAGCIFLLIRKHLRAMRQA